MNVQKCHMYPSDLKSMFLIKTLYLLSTFSVWNKFYLIILKFFRHSAWRNVMLFVLVKTYHFKNLPPFMSNKFHRSTKQQSNISITLKMISKIHSETLNIFTSYWLYFRPEEPCGQRVPGLFPRGKDYLASSLQKVYRYLHSPSGPSWPITWWILHYL